MQSVKFEDGKLQLTASATSRLRIEAEGHEPAEKSIFLDYPPLLDLILNLRAEDLLAWNTFERIRSLLNDEHLSFELEPGWSNGRVGVMGVTPSQVIQCFWDKFQSRRFLSLKWPFSPSKMP